MTGTTKGIVLRLFYCSAVIGTLLGATAIQSYAEPLLLVYPNKPAIFHYNTSEYSALMPGHPDYDPGYSAGGVTLWDNVEDRVAYEVFRAPALAGFQPSTSGMNEFVLMTNEFNLIVDGYGDYPRQLNKLYVQFAPAPPHATALVEMAGEDLWSRITPIPGIDAREPTSDGRYAGTRTLHIRWSGSVGIRFTAFGDKNNNRAYDGGVPKWSIYVMDNTVPVEETSWGAIKAMYRE
jgi:hypothetical protein